MEYQTSGNASLYGAFGDYEKSVRDRKYKTSVAEDEISHLKSTIEQAVANNQLLKNRCENTKLQHEKEEALFQTELKKKHECEVEIESLIRKCEERNVSLKKKKALSERIKQSHESNVETLKKANDNFLIGYKTIPSVAEYLEATDDLKALEEEHNQTLTQVNEHRVSMIELNKRTESEWLILQIACIKMANLSKRTREIESQIETMKLMDLAFTNVEAMEQGTTSDTSAALLEDNAAINLSDGNNDVIPKGSRATPEVKLEETVGNLEKRLQQLRTRCSSFVPNNTPDRSSAKPSPSGLIGIKRYLNAKDELDARRLRTVQDQKTPLPLETFGVGDHRFQKPAKNNSEWSSKLGEKPLNVGTAEGVIQKSLQQIKLKFLEGAEKPRISSCSEEVDMDVSVSTKEVNTVPKPSNTLLDITKPLKSPSATDFLPKNQNANQNELCGNDNYSWSAPAESILQPVDSTPKPIANCKADNQENIPSLNEILRKYQDPANKDIFKKPLPPKVVQPKHIAIDIEWSDEEQQQGDHVRVEDNNFMNSKSLGLEPFTSSSSSSTSGLMDIFGNGTTTQLNDKPATENDSSTSGDSSFNLDNFFSNCSSNQPLF